MLAGKPEGKRPLGRLRGRWEHTIKMDINKCGRMLTWLSSLKTRRS